MKDIKTLYREHCEERGISFEIKDKVNSYDDTTLFCPAGMQQYKETFKDESKKGTVANIQSCIRMNDFDEIGDTTHLLYFNMIGLFSFREMTINEAVDFWMSFVQDKLGLKLSYVTIHPDRKEWHSLYTSYEVEVRQQEDCVWSDGEIGGYCTEFFIDDVEIGNIVNPLGNCIDVGFGLERLELFVNETKISKERTLLESAQRIIDSGFKPSNLRQGYVLRKLLREIYKLGLELDHEFFKDEILRQTKIKERYEKLKHKHIGMSKEWWYDTHGIDIDDMD
jgi:alanyl-tRNA synthetase